MGNSMFYPLSSYVKKHCLIDVQQKFSPGTFVKSNGIICIQFANFQNAKHIHPQETVLSLPTGFQI